MRIFRGHRILNSGEVSSGILSGGMKDTKEPAKQSEVVKNISDEGDNQASLKTFLPCVLSILFRWPHPGCYHKQCQHSSDY